MQTYGKTRFLLYTVTLFMCLNSFFLGNTAAQVNNQSADSAYTFETIDVPGVDFLAVTASSDFEDYAGYTKSPDGQKEVAFTLIDGVFTTYDFPDSQMTHFYALGNNGIAAGYYQDSDGLHHGVVLENGELRRYDFEGAVQTEIYGISDVHGVLMGNFIDAAGVRRGFGGDIIIEFPGATATYANFATTDGAIIGSYIDAEGLYHTYVGTPRGQFLPIDYLDPSNLEYFFAHGVSDAAIVIARAKAVDDVPRTYIGPFHQTPQEHELQFPGSVSTEGWDINRDGSIVGHYDSADGRRHGFIARPKAADKVPVTSADFTYTFETINVPGVDDLAVTASSDFEDYAGYTQNTDSGKEVAFTLIDGVFKTYDFPGAQKTHFYALGNNGRAAGHYQDSNGLFHGVIVEPDGEMRQYDFPDAVQTEIFGISDATGALTGNFIDAAGVRRGFSGDVIIEFPGATATYADFVNASGVMVGSYVNAEGVYNAYIRAPDNNFIHYFSGIGFEYLFVHGITDSGITIARVKEVDDVPRTYVSNFQSREVAELWFPGSVSTEGWNINQDHSVVGHYESADGRRHGFIARLDTKAAPVDKPDDSGDRYTVSLAKGLNMISVPLQPNTPMTAKSLAALTGATTVITLDTANQQFVGWTPDAPDDGFSIEGGQGYIVNVSEARQVAFVGSAWTNQMDNAAAAPAITSLIRGDRGVAQETWAFVVSGHLQGKPAFDGYQVIVRNQRTDRAITASVRGDYFAAATADLARRRVVQVGDLIEVRVIGPDGNVESHTLSYKVTPEALANAVLSIRIDRIGQPKLTQLLQNFPNPFNPETWIPYQLDKSGDVVLQIYDTSGNIVRTIDLGFKGQGFYMTRATAAYWDGRNNMGETVASGVYFYRLQTSDFSATRKMLILK